MNAKVDIYLNNAKKWQQEMILLRTIILNCALTEELKWRIPCYTFNNNNVVLINSFKNYCAIGFFKGAMLNDTNNILDKPGENTQSARLIKFTSVKEIEQLKNSIKNYIYEAIEIEKAGLKVAFKNNAALVFVEELQKKLNENPALNTAFKALTPGRQRAYNLYFDAPKQSKTKEGRIEKYTLQILSVKGINDCTCGLSKKMPYCDGSHKFMQ
jgi:uncharacterized protein YdeI (YjbR/CyaY-like superfamily)